MRSFRFIIALMCVLVVAPLGGGNRVEALAGGANDRGAWIQLRKEPNDTPASRGARRVLLQLPEGLKRRARELCGFLEERSGATVMVQGESVYGACDTGHGFQRLGVDAVIHFGHSPIPELHDSTGSPATQEVPYHFVEVTIPVDAQRVADSIAGYLARELPDITKLRLLA